MNLVKKCACLLVLHTATLCGFSPPQVIPGTLFLVVLQYVFHASFVLSCSSQSYGRRTVLPGCLKQVGCHVSHPTQVGHPVPAVFSSADRGVAGNLLWRCTKDSRCDGIIGAEENPHSLHSSCAPLLRAAAVSHHLRSGLLLVFLLLCRAPFPTCWSSRFRPPRNPRVQV